MKTKYTGFNSVGHAHDNAGKSLHTQIPHHPLLDEAPSSQTKTKTENKKGKEELGTNEQLISNK